YKPWSFGWSFCLAGLIWNGALLSKTEASFAFNILSITGTSVQFSAAIASLLLGPPCYCLLAGITGTSCLVAVLFPFPCADFPNLCKDPLRYE
ncbi:transmembrane protein 212, partial [Chiroxiphia lanceolata]|uniref:transmembrane protein 212 n=1 Tax=Chiroxiphia lanceolata TaxID=296741 RepID=UPI0013CF36FB